MLQITKLQFLIHKPLLQNNALNFAAGYKKRHPLLRLLLRINLTSQK